MTMIVGGPGGGYSTTPFLDQIKRRNKMDIDALKCKNCGLQPGDHIQGTKVCPNQNGVTFYNPAYTRISAERELHNNGKKKVVVPEGMIDAACYGYPKDERFREGIKNRLEAAIRWQSENPITPTDRQWYECVNESQKLGYPSNELYAHAAAEWQRRCFLADDEPEVPEEIKRLWESSPTPETKRRIVEAFRIGQKSKAEPVRS